MSKRFLIATLFLLCVFTGGIMTGDQMPVTWLEGILMIGGFIGTVGSLLLLKGPKWNTKLWKW